jgi:hypothetical protein
MSANLGLGLGALGLMALAMHPEVASVYYNAKTVNIDGYTFRGCRFDGCTLTANSTNFRLDHCVLDDKCIIQFGPNLVKVVQLFTSRYPWWESSSPGLAPVRHDDGTISIGV